MYLYSLLCVFRYFGENTFWNIFNYRYLCTFTDAQSLLDINSFVISVKNIIGKIESWPPSLLKQYNNDHSVNPIHAWDTLIICGFTKMYRFCFYLSEKRFLLLPKFVYTYSLMLSLLHIKSNILNVKNIIL